MQTGWYERGKKEREILGKKFLKKRKNKEQRRAVYRIEEKKKQ